MWRIDSARMWSLGYFRTPPPEGINPSVFNSARWSALFTRWLQKRVGQFTDLDVRHPGHIHSMLSSYEGGGVGSLDDGDDWHQDGMYFDNTHLGCWSNTVSTHIRVKGSRSRTIYQPEPCEFVLFDNKFFEHRPPYEDVSPEEASNRWFVRVSAGCSLRAHPDVKECTL